MNDLKSIAKSIRRHMEGHFNGMFDTEVSQRMDNLIMGCIKQIYRTPNGRLSHTGIESQMRNDGFMKMGKMGL